MLRYFIADLHLTEDKPVLITGFLSFLNELPDSCELYILGDLFDYWVGDDAHTELHQQVADALNHLSLKKINSYFVCGNRDFLLGNRYAALCHMQILPDINCLPLAKMDDVHTTKQNLIFLHGDLLCTDDINYQNFRKKMHTKWLQQLFLWLPLRFRQRIAQKLRQKSKAHNQVKSDEIMDVNQQAVVNMMSQYNALYMVHGHTHKPATHEFEHNHQTCQRVVLGAWHDGISYIKYDDADNSVMLYHSLLEPLL